jgi:predicted RNase H-like HicB family nuclease
LEGLVRLKERKARMTPREIWEFVRKGVPTLLEKLADDEGLLVARKRLRDRDRLLSIKDINRLLREGRRRSRRKAARAAAEARADARDARIAERRIAELDAGRVRAISSEEMRERLGLGPRGDKPQAPYSHRYHFVFWLEDEIWSAKAPSVRGVYGVGPTAEEARDDLVEALKAMSDHLEDVGESKKAAVCGRLVKAWQRRK